MADFQPGLALRSQESELLDTERVSEESLTRAYRELSWVNRWLGNTRAVVQLLRRDEGKRRPLRVLDIGCGQGALLIEIQRKLSAGVVGVDVRALAFPAQVPIFRRDAVVDPLPKVDVAVCVLMAHHLTDAEFLGMIGNVAQSAKRLIVLDLVRHAVPLWLFRIFVAPWLGRINAADGQTSIRRAYTASELGSLVQKALTQISQRAISVRHTVAPFWIRQVVDIRWE